LIKGDSTELVGEKMSPPLSNEFLNSDSEISKNKQTRKFLHGFFEVRLQHFSIMIFGENSPTAAEGFLIKMALLQSPYEL
jgi:hypothetical protein